MLPAFYQKHRHFPANTEGRDFVVGDLHGMYDTLMTFLNHLEFDRTVDRLFSVGDLVDRGPDSRKCAELIYEPFFHCVRGNHEQLMIDALLSNYGYAMQSWIGNGGIWGAHGTPDEKEENKILAREFERLPLVISVGEGANRFNIVHAELVHRAYVQNHPVRVPITDGMLDKWCFSAEEENELIWGRTMISNGSQKYPPADHERYHDLDNLSLTFVGHTPVRYPIKIQRQMYLDGGAVFHHLHGNKTGSTENTMMIASPADQQLYVMTMATGEIKVVHFADVEQQS